MKSDLYREKINHITCETPYSTYTGVYEGGDRPFLYLHWHPEAELFMVREGQLELTVEDQTISLCAGEAVFIPPQMLHTAGSGSSGVFRALVFSTDLVVPPSDTARFRKYVQPVLTSGCKSLLHLKPKTHGLLLADLERLFRRTDEQADSSLFVEGMIGVIWDALYRAHFSRLEYDGGQNRIAGQMEKVVRFICERYQEELTLEQMAVEVHMSKSQLCRSFRQFTGVTPFAYLKRHRILRSCEWLVNSDRQILEISQMCGFNSISYFNREFLKILKVTPSVYRKRHSMQPKA